MPPHTKNVNIRITHARFGVIKPKKAKCNIYKRTLFTYLFCTYFTIQAFKYGYIFYIEFYIIECVYAYIYTYTLYTRTIIFYINFADSRNPNILHII